MKRQLVVACSAALALPFIAAGTALAADEPEQETTIVSNEVIGSPDNTLDGKPWARDTFTRTLTITPLPEEANADYSVRSEIEGTWEETNGTGSRGDLTGYVTYTVTGALSEANIDTWNGDPVDLSEHPTKEALTPIDQAGSFALRYFDEGATSSGVQTWEYVYTNACTSYTENADSEHPVGPDTFSPCAVPEAPEVTPATCDAPAELVVPEVTGVVYDKESGPVEQPGDMTITATPADGYTFPDSTEPVWTLRVSPAPSECDSTEVPPAQVPPAEEPPAEELPVEESPAADGCDAYENSGDWCEPGVEDYDCGEIAAADKPVVLADVDNDPFSLDGDDDGLGCEGSDTPGDDGGSDDGGSDDGGSDDGDGGAAGYDGEGTLPDTGSAGTWIGLAGLALLAGGGALVWYRRRTGVSIGS